MKRVRTGVQAAELTDLRRHLYDATTSLGAAIDCAGLLLTAPGRSELTTLLEAMQQLERTAQEVAVRLALSAVARGLPTKEDTPDE